MDACLELPMPPQARSQRALRLYRWMLQARAIDAMERELVARGEAAFHVSGAGHEASAALALHLRPGDYLHGHYRDKALMLGMGLPLRQFFDSLLGTANSHSAGRQMSAHLSAPGLGILSTVGPVGNHALQAVGVAQELCATGREGVVVCSMGDGTTQQGEVMEAIAEAVRGRLPVLFLVHDNRYAISTTTSGRTFFSLPQGAATEFHGCAIHRLDGSDPTACDHGFGVLMDGLRRGEGPVICVMAMERLCDHTNADDERAYRSEAELRRARAVGDPLARARADMVGIGWTMQGLQHLQAEVDSEVRAAAEMALRCPPPVANPDPAPERPRVRVAELEQPATMAQALRQTLLQRLHDHPRVSLYGQDIEDPKGDVFGLTRGLSTAFPGRVRNAPLSESTIVGTAIGRALVGGRPVAFVQFADFLPLALNQLMSELATLSWRTAGGWRAPVVVLASCGAYRPGLGPFHAQTLDSLLAHVPGLDVLVPSTPTDAAAMLQAVFVTERPSVLLYPKALLHVPRAEQVDMGSPYGARLRRAGRDLTMVAWGNTVELCEQAAAVLEGHGVSVDLLDLRWLAPWDAESVIRSVQRTRKLLVAHEDQQTGGFGAEVVARVTEALGGGVVCKRVARQDGHIPFHPVLQDAVLPTRDRVLEAAAELLDLDLVWHRPAGQGQGTLEVPVIAGSPADQTVVLTELAVSVGQAVVAGQALASVEADKATFDIAAPAAGIVETLHLQVGDKAAVGAALLTLRTLGPVRARAAAAPAVAVLRPRTAHRSVKSAVGSAVMLQAVAAVTGAATLHNRDLARLLDLDEETGAQALLRSTGIESRCVASPEQDVVGMAAAAARQALDEAGVDPARLSAIICSTSTPVAIAPSTACRVLQQLAPGADVPAYDVLAACSGYLYALAQAWDHLQQRPDGSVLVLTAETMRRIVDPHDPSTSPIFGDAATATLLSREASGRSLARLHRPLVGARGDDGLALQVPLQGAVRMDGRAVFVQAVRTLCEAISDACRLAGWRLQDLDLVVPHQANGRILDAVGARLALPPERLWNEIRDRGNTSSSSIPLALSRVMRASQARRIGLCAFGAGYTHGAALLERD